MWAETENGLVETFEFKNFFDTFVFMNQVALICEWMEHHAIWEKSYHQVTVYLYNDKKQDKLRKRAASIDEIYYNI